nr:uncharacterized protein LOC117847729 [Setaria viridis]
MPPFLSLTPSRIAPSAQRAPSLASRDGAVLAGRFRWRAGDGAVSGLKAREVTVTSHPRAIFFAPLLPGAPSPLPPPVRSRFAGGSRYSGGALCPRRCCDDMDFQGRRRAAAALVAAVAAWFFLWFRRRSEDARSITYGPMAERDRERNSNLRFIYESDDVHCANLLRMRRAPFFQLCDLFRSRELVVDSIHATVEEQVAMFLHVVGHNQRFRVINMTFRRSIETISRFFHQVLYAVGELRNELIVPPSTSVHPRILGSRRWNPYFKDCIGAIDGTHVLARVPLKMQAAFRGRKHTITQNVLAAVDFDLRFTYVLAGWEGSAHDALILSDALERTDGLTVPQGKFYLVDAGYAARPGFLPPYRGTRHGEDEHVPTEAAWTPNSTDTPPEPELSADNGTWAQQRDAWAAQMWQNRGSSRV